METEPIPHYLIDARSSEEASAIPLPTVLANAIHIPYEKMVEVLKDSTSWRLHVGDRISYPTPQHLLLFISSLEDEMMHSARVAAAHAFQRYGSAKQSSV